MSKNSKILITGGHFTPALAVLDELEARRYNNIVWAGVKHNQVGSKSVTAEYSTITKRDIRFYNIKAGKLVRKWTLQTFLNGIWNIFLLFIGFIQALFIIVRERPMVVISFGGYVAVPIVTWARVFGAKVLTHEQTITTGLANKIVTRFAHTICVSWEDSLIHFPEHKTVYTGNPIRKEIFTIQNQTELTTFEQEKPLLYITGGNQGAHEINKRIFPIVVTLTNSFNVIHQTGNSTVTNDFVKAKALEQKGYKVFDYLNATEAAEALQQAEVVLARAGANTVTELALLNRKSVLIPIPWVSHNEQMLNAQYLQKNGLAIILEQNDALTSESIVSALTKILEMQVPRKPIDIKTDAQKLVVDEVEKLLV